MIFCRNFLIPENFRFGEAGPLVDGVVVSLANLPSFIRNTILNTSRRDVAEIEKLVLKCHAAK